ncbi:MAG: Ig-like domain-containing protein, partial [Acidimicrobiales bacterium]
MPRTSPTSRAHRTLITGVVALLVALGLGLTRPDPAAAAVTQLHGYRATVLGWTSWYGSYGMGPVGPAFCIDHGIRAPDPAFSYVPADLSGVPAATRSAMGWVVGAHGHGTDRVRHAAVMLVLHDLMGARYPQGRIDVDRLTTAQLAGFGGAEATIIERARAMKAEGLARAHLRGTLRLSATLTGRAGDGTTTLTVSVRDADGRAVPGITVTLQATGASLPAGSIVTGQDGRAHLRLRPGAGAVRVQSTATV